MIALPPSALFQADATAAPTRGHTTEAHTHEEAGRGLRQRRRWPAMAAPRARVCGRGGCVLQRRAERGDQRAEALEHQRRRRSTLPSRLPGTTPPHRPPGSTESASDERNRRKKWIERGTFFSKRRRQPSEARRSCSLTCADVPTAAVRSHWRHRRRGARLRRREEDTEERPLVARGPRLAPVWRREHGGAPARSRVGPDEGVLHACELARGAKAGDGEQVDRGAKAGPQDRAADWISERVAVCWLRACVVVCWRWASAVADEQPVGRRRPGMRACLL